MKTNYSEGDYFNIMKKFMQLGIDKANITMILNEGGPFGAVIVKNNKIICVESNNVLKNNDPTAHAEIQAIRKAGEILETFDLSGCELYATGYPCPMCLSAIIWANIKKVYYCNTVKQAEEIGFRDDFIYNYLKTMDKNVLEISELKIDNSLFEDYKNMNREIY